MQPAAEPAVTYMPVLTEYAVESPEVVEQVLLNNLSTLGTPIADSLEWELLDRTEVDGLKMPLYDPVGLELPDGFEVVRATAMVIPKED